MSIHSKENMNKKIMMLCIVSIVINSYSEHIINVSLRPYPANLDMYQINKRSQKLKEPGQLAKYSIKTFIQEQQVAGIIATYKGYITTSNLNGEITFPNKQTKPLLYLLVSNYISPISMIETVLHHWELEEGTPAAFYRIERKQDEETEQYYWTIQQEELPKDNVIPTTTICFIAKPQKIFVPVGISLTKKGENLILPHIYVKEGIMKIAHVLYMLNLRHFFQPVKKTFKQEKMYRLEQIM